MFGYDVVRACLMQEAFVGQALIPLYLLAKVMRLERGFGEGSSASHTRFHVSRFYDTNSKHLIINFPVQPTLSSSSKWKVLVHNPHVQTSRRTARTHTGGRKTLNRTTIKI
jgi:hypothetical protein